MHPSRDELRTFIGPNAEYYMQAWASAKPDGEPQRLRWNWPAFFLNIVWLLYRRMYRYFWIGFGVLAAIGLVEGTAEALLHFKTPAYMDPSINLFVALNFGGYGTWFYYRHAMKTIGETQVKLVSPDAIAQAGGVRWLWPVLLGTVVGLGVVAAIVVKLKGTGL